MSDVLLEKLLYPYTAVQAMVHEGGPFVMMIFLCGVVMWTLVIERYWYFTRMLPRDIETTLVKWRARGEHQSWCARQIRTMLISSLNAGMSANMPLLRVLVPLSPLLGLIGTVSGMLQVFDSMALKGSADARAMAAGVSEAMTCTMTGLAVSISGLYPVYYFQNRTKVETELMSDKLVY
jgi:biopolymer transport protein ExbB